MLTACSTAPTDPSVEYRVWSPPAHLLADCPVTPWSGGDWAEVVELAQARQADLARCNADKRALREALREARETFRGL